MGVHRVGGLGGGEVFKGVSTVYLFHTVYMKKKTLKNSKKNLAAVMPWLH